MLTAILRWALILACLFALGPLLARLLMDLRDADGGRAVTFLVNHEPVRALLSMLAVFGTALAVGMIGSRFFSLATGWACAGFILAWATSALGSLEEIVRRTGDGRALPWLGIEGLAVAVGAGLIAWLCTRVAARIIPASPVVSVPQASRGRVAVTVGLPAASVALASGTGLDALPIADLPDSRHTAPRRPARLIFEGAPEPGAPLIALAAIAAGALVCGILVWLIAVTGARMQTFAAATVGSIGAGVVAHFVTAGRGYRLSPVVPMIAVGLCALLGPIIARAIDGPQLLAHIYDASVFHVARPVSLDWAAGALLGVPLGLGWAASAAERRVK